MITGRAAQKWSVAWHAGRLLTALRGDRDIINAVAAHPSAPVLASCGLDSSVKLWGPRYGGGVPASFLHGCGSKSWVMSTQRQNSDSIYGILAAAIVRSDKIGQWCGSCAGDWRLKRRYLATVAGHNESTRRQLVTRDEHRSHMRMGIHEF